MSNEDKLIIKFMGIIYAKDPNVKNSTKYYHYKELNLMSQTLHFKTSWDWLMPVVEKIESIYDGHHGYFAVHISSNACNIQGTNLWKALKQGSNYGFVYMSDPNSIFNTKLKSIYHNVSKFIDWYFNVLRKKKIKTIRNGSRG